MTHYLARYEQLIDERRYCHRQASAYDALFRVAASPVTQLEAHQQQQHHEREAGRCDAELRILLLHALPPGWLLMQLARVPKVYLPPIDPLNLER